MEAGDGRHFWCWCWCEFQVTLAANSPAFTRRADLAAEGANRAGFAAGFRTHSLLSRGTARVSVAGAGRNPKSEQHGCLGSKAAAR